MTVPSRLDVSGHYAGAATRAAGAALDIGIIFGLFTAGVAGVDLLSRVILGVSLAGDRSGVLWTIILVVWTFLYVAVSLIVAGRTLGKGIVGLRVVMADGTTLTPARALVRTLAFPLSALLLGLGFVGIFIHREHRALHDLIAGTAVVVDWGERVAELPGPLTAFLAKRADVEPASLLPAEPQ